MPGTPLRLVDNSPALPDWDAQPDPPLIPVPGRHVDARPNVFLEALVPQRWRGRFELGPWHVVAVLVAVCGALAAATWLTLHRQPHLVAEPVVPGATVTAVSAPVTNVTVDVEGAVRRPGIVVLKSGARVVDALKEAGGALHPGQMHGLNLASLLSDGQQVVVGDPAGGSDPPGASADQAGMVNLNMASADELDAIPGVGPVTADSIVAWRRQHGSFRSVDELLEVDGIGPGKFAKIKPHVTV